MLVQCLPILFFRRKNNIGEGRPGGTGVSSIDEIEESSLKRKIISGPEAVSAEGDGIVIRRPAVPDK
jgi:hypothetical protein